MKKKIFFDLAYTRDCTLIIQEEWLRSLRVEYVRLAGTAQAPIGFDYYSQGVTEVWQNREELEHIQAGLRRESKSQPEHLLQRLKQYQKNLRVLWPAWKRGYCANLLDLRHFWQRAKVLMPGDMLLCLLPEIAGVSGAVAREVHKLRSEDIFFASTDSVLRTTLTRLYPRLRTYATCVREHEVWAKLPSMGELHARYQHCIIRPGEPAQVQTIAQYLRRNSSFSLVGVRVALRQTSVRGFRAVPGVARGLVRVVRSNSDAAKVRPGEIIVAPMTTPVMVPAIARAAGIATDEGGVICHAAIVARELGKPCLTGTHIATKIFRTGEQVVLNATRGMIYKRQ